MNLKMQMRPRRAAGVADVGNDLPGFDLLACGDADARAVRVQCRQSTAVVELDVVAITAAPTVEGVGDSDGAVGSRQDRGAFGHSDTLNFQIGIFIEPSAWEEQSVYLQVGYDNVSGVGFSYFS